MSLAEAPIISRAQPEAPDAPETTSLSARLEAAAQISDKVAPAAKKNAKRPSIPSLNKEPSDGQETPRSPAKPNAGPLFSRDGSKLSFSPTSPTHADSPFMTPSSPARAMTSSPRLSSPAGSQIFERDVQDSVVIPRSPAIPAHIQTENHIPPALDASSEAITDIRLNPDSVEIITHSSHQPAAVTVTGTSPTFTYEQMASSWGEDFSSLAATDRDDAASNYGSFDGPGPGPDVRRLSFISFADVVQAEHGGFPAGSRESVHLGGLASFPGVLNRSPSPVRSPVSSQGPGTSPPTSKSGSVKGFEMSPARKPLGSPISSHYNFSGVSSEINVETMSQALRHTASADLSAHRSIPTSPIEGPSR